MRLLARALQELDPARPASAWRRSETMARNDVAHARRRDRDAELSQLAEDAETSPSLGIPVRQHGPRSAELDRWSDDLVIGSVAAGRARAISLMVTDAPFSCAAAAAMLPGAPRTCSESGGRLSATWTESAPEVPAFDAHSRVLKPDQRQAGRLELVEFPHK